MEPIGYVPVQLIPSLDGWSELVDKQLGGKLQVTGKQGGKKLAKGIGEGLKDLERDVDSAGKTYQKLRDKAEDALGKVRVEEEKLAKARAGGKTDQIVAAEERLSTARRNSTRATSDAKDGFKEFEQAQKSLANNSDDLGGKFGNLTGLAGGAGDAIKGAAVVAAGAAVVGIAALAAGVLAAGNALYDLGSEFDDVFDNIRIKTGATGPALQQLEDATKRIATNVPLSIGEIGNVVAETSRALHVTGIDLDNTSKAIANLGRETGEAIDVRKLGQVLNGFGVGVKDQVPALDSLLQAYQSTGIGVNELLESVSKGTAQLKAFHLGIGPTTALLASFNAAGLDGDKAIAGLGKALAYLSGKGVADPQKGLADIVTQIKALNDAGNEASGRDLANKVFGAKGGKDFFDQIQSGALDLQSLNGTLAGTGDTIAGLADDTDDWAEKWQVFKNGLKVNLEPIGTAVFDEVNGKLTELADWVDNHKDEVVIFFQHVGDAAIGGAQAILHFAADSLRGLSGFVKGATDSLKPLFDTMANVGSVLQYVPGFMDIGRGLKSAGEGGQALSDALSGVPGKLNAGADALDALAPKLDPLKAKWDNITDAVANSLKLTGALGDKVTATLNTKGEIQLSADDADVTAKLAEIGVNVKAVDGVVTISADTTEGQAILDAWRTQQTGKPVLVGVGANLTPANADIQKWADGLKIGAGVQVPVHATPTGGPLIGPGPGGGRATGGMVDPSGRISGPGSGTSDSIIAAVTGGGAIRVSNQESINTASSTRANWPVIDAMNHGANLTPWLKLLPGFAIGGAIAPDVIAAQALAGTKYSQPNRTDCSGMAARVIARALGLPESGLMTTKNASQWLAAAGFQPGIGGPGQVSVGWYDHGPGSNDGHMAMTLSDGTHAEAGGKNSVFTLGAGAAGADSPQFDQHMFLPTLFGEGQAGSLGGYSGGSSGGGTPGIGPNGESGTYAAPDAKAAREADEKVADADARARQAELKQKELKADAKESEKQSAQAEVDKATREAADARADRDEVMRGKFTADKDKSSSGSGGTPLGLKLPSAFSGLASIGLDGMGFSTQASANSPVRTFGFGDALGAAVGGQVSSALDVFGVGDTPPFLQAASQLLGGISVGGGGSSSAPSIAALAPAGTGTPPPPDDGGNVHGRRAGQNPGTAGPVYNATFNTNDDTAFKQWQRWQNDRVGANLDSK